MRLKIKTACYYSRYIHSFFKEDPTFPFAIFTWKVKIYNCSIHSTYVKIKCILPNGTHTKLIRDCQIPETGLPDHQNTEQSAKI